MVLLLIILGCVNIPCLYVNYKLGNYKICCVSSFALGFCAAAAFMEAIL